MCLDIAINEGEGYYLGIKLLRPALESLTLYFQGAGRFRMINVTISEAVNSSQLGTESGDTPETCSFDFALPGLSCQSLAVPRAASCSQIRGSAPVAS